MTKTTTEHHSDHLLDAGQSSCGDLLVLMFKEMKALAPGQVLKVVGYDSGALADIPAWCRLTHNPLLHVETSDDNSMPTLYFIQKGYTL